MRFNASVRHVSVSASFHDSFRYLHLRLRQENCRRHICNGGDAGPVVGQLTTITLQPKIFGISLNIGTVRAGAVAIRQPIARAAASLRADGYLYGTSDMTIADVDAHNRPALRGFMEPQHRRRHPRLHRLQRHQQDRNGLHHRQRRRRHQQPHSGLRSSGRYQRRSWRADSTSR